MQPVMAKSPALGKVELIRQAQNGNQAAFTELYQQHVDAIYHYIHKRVQIDCEAEDLTQVVFLKAWHALRDYQPTAAPFRAWLYRIAHNAVIDHYRTQHPVVAWDELVTLVDSSALPEMVVLNAERQTLLHNAIARLRPAYREVITHRFLRNLDYAETAAVLGQQVNNVRVLQHRALDALRRVLVQESVLWLVMVATAATLLLGTQLVHAAAAALPGDQLYPLRTAVEAAALSISDDAAAVRLHTDFAEQRLAELQALTAQGRMADLRVAVADYTTQLAAASTKLAAVTAQPLPANQQLRTQFGQRLTAQSATLTTFVAAAPPAVRTTLQPAVVALTTTQQALAASEPLPPAPLPTPTPTAVPAHASLHQAPLLQPTAAPAAPAPPASAPPAPPAAAPPTFAAAPPSTGIPAADPRPDSGGAPAAQLAPAEDAPALPASPSIAPAAPTAPRPQEQQVLAPTPEAAPAHAEQASVTGAAANAPVVDRANQQLSPTPPAATHEHAPADPPADDHPAQARRPSQ